MKPRVEIHIPISPTESFFRQVHYLVVSLRQRGGILKNSPIIVTVGDDCEPYDIQRKVPWTREYPIEFRWVSRLLYQKQSYFATGLQRYQYPFQAPFVLFLDADMGLSRNLDDLLDRAAQDPGFYSVLAYGSPWGNSDLLHVRSDEDWWREAFAAASLGEPPFTCEYAGSGVIFDERVRRCPPYFNQGFVLAPASMVSALGSVLSQELEAATRAAETFYRFQVALTLAIVRQNLPWRAPSIRFNFAPALADVFKVMPEESEDARVLHYFNTAQFAEWFDKNALIGTPGAMEQWLRQPSKTPVEAYMRQLFFDLHSEVMRGNPDVRTPWWLRFISRPRRIGN